MYAGNPPDWRLLLLNFRWKLRKNGEGCEKMLVRIKRCPRDKQVMIKLKPWPGMPVVDSQLIYCSGALGCHT